jgi:hypothetical protein
MKLKKLGTGTGTRYAKFTGTAPLFKFPHSSLYTGTVLRSEIRVDISGGRRQPGANSIFKKIKKINKKI